MRILFQGDSITDAGRVREDITNLGTGYPLLVAAELGLKEPGEYEFFNKGIGGNRVVDVYARIKSDIIDLKPDVMSILIGVNDVWHDFLEMPNGVDADKYYKIYDMLIEEVKAALPDIKIIIMEPFILKASETEKDWNVFYAEVKKRAQMAKKIAEKYHLSYILFQEDFLKLTESAEASYWLKDGVHPTPVGHEHIKNQWLKAFKAL